MVGASGTPESTRSILYVWLSLLSCEVTLISTVVFPRSTSTWCPAEFGSESAMALSSASSISYVAPWPVTGVIVTRDSSTSAVYLDTPGSNSGSNSPGVTVRALSATSQKGRSTSSRSSSSWDKSRHNAGMQPLSRSFPLR